MKLIINCRSGGIGRHAGLKIQYPQKMCGFESRRRYFIAQLKCWVFFMYYVYAISSINANYIYVGLTDNVERRVTQHNAGFEKTTKPYGPFEIILVEEFANRPAARDREKYLKTTTGKRLLRKLRDGE